MTLLPSINLPTGVDNLVIYKTLLDMQSHVTLMIYLKGKPILETDKKITGCSGKFSDLPTYPLFVFMAHVTNHHKLSSLKEHTFIISKLSVYQESRHKLAGFSALNQGAGKSCNLM